MISQWFIILTHSNNFRCLQEIDYLANVVTNNIPITNRLQNHPTGLDGNNNITRKSNHRNSAIFVGVNSNSNSYNEISLKKPGNVAIKPSRPAPSTPLITSINSSSPSSSENQALPKDDIDLVPFDHENSSFFPRSAEELLKKDVNFINDEQSSPKHESHSIENTSVSNGIDETIFNLNSENNNGHERGGTNYSSVNNKSKQIGEWKLPNQVKNKSKLIYSKSAAELKEEEEQLACYHYPIMQ